MPSNRLSSADQDRLIVAAEFVTKRAEEDVHPTDALAEAIDKFNLKAGEASVVANNYNVGAQVAQWHMGKNAEERLRGAPMANAAQAMTKSEKLKVAKTAAVGDGWGMGRDSEDFYLPPEQLKPRQRTVARVKQAEAEQKPAPAALTPSQLYAQWKEAEALHNETDVNFRVKQDTVRRKIASIDSWFAERGNSNVHAGTLNAVCEDPAEQIICSAITCDNAQRKFASYDRVAEPVRMVKEAAVALADAEEAQRLFLYAGKLAEDAKKNYLRGSNPDRRPELPVEELLSTKQSSVLPFMAGTQAMDAFNRYRTSMKEEAKNDVQGALNKLEDSDIQRRMNAIEVQTMIAEMLSDPDSPIAGRDPEEVIGHYNNLIQVAPAIANRPAAVKPFLARSLSGEMSPFEIDQMLQMDERVRKATGFNPYYSMPGQGTSTRATK